MKTQLMNKLPDLRHTPLLFLENGLNLTYTLPASTFPPSTFKTKSPLSLFTNDATGNKKDCLLEIIRKHLIPKLKQLKSFI